MRGKVVVVQATLLILVFDLVQYAQARQKASTPSSIKVDVNLVLVPVAITNSQGHFVQGLHAEDFQIWEDKVEQKIEYFSSEDTPVSLAMVFDMSGSMERKLAAAREAATACLKTGNSEDDYLLVEFGDRARIAQDFTTKVGTLQSHLTFTSAQGYTAFLDAVYLALENVKFGKNPRKALLMITDGEDNHSRYSFSNVKEFLNESDVQLYAIGTLNVPYLKSGNSVGRALLEERARADHDLALGDEVVERRGVGCVHEPEPISRRGRLVTAGQDDLVLGRQRLAQGAGPDAGSRHPGPHGVVGDDQHPRHVERGYRPDWRRSRLPPAAS